MIVTRGETPADGELFPYRITYVGLECVHTLHKLEVAHA